MASSGCLVSEQKPNGFDFDLCKRNAWLEKQGLQTLKPWSTGTTICGVVYKVRVFFSFFFETFLQSKRTDDLTPSASLSLSFFFCLKDGVVLGADTRSTAGETVADKNCEKIHYMAPNIYCCGAGTAADTENVTGMISSQLELHRFRTNRESRVVTSLTLLKSHLFRYQGYISAALVLGGVDCKGPHLFTVFPHGSTDALPFCTMGSGSLNAMAVYESGYKEDMSKAEAMELTKRAIRAGIFNDLGSGSNVDLCVITSEGAEYLRNVDMPNPRTFTAVPKPFARGTTPVLKSKELRVPSLESRVTIESQEGDVATAMDTT